MTDGKHTIRNWSAKRSGDSITVTGEDCATASNVCFGSVTSLTPNGGTVLAVTKDGTEYQLLV